MTLDDINAAANLLYYGLEGRLTPEDNKHYAALMSRFNRDNDFAQVVRTLAEGQRLQILESEGAQSGLVLQARSSDSLYARQLDDLRNMDASEKQLYGLILCTVVKVLFPTEQSLYSLDNARVPVPVTTMLAELERLREAYGRRDQAETGADDVLDGWAAMSRLVVKNGKEVRANRKSLLGYLKLVLNDLTTQGLVRMHGIDKGDESAGSLFATTRLQVHAREVALPAWFEVIRKTAAAAAHSERAPSAP